MGSSEHPVQQHRSGVAIVRYMAPMCGRRPKAQLANPRRCARFAGAEATATQQQHNGWRRRGRHLKISQLIQPIGGTSANPFGPGPSAAAPDPPSQQKSSIFGPVWMPIAAVVVAPRTGWPSDVLSEWK